MQQLVCAFLMLYYSSSQRPNIIPRLRNRTFFEKSIQNKLIYCSTHPLEIYTIRTEVQTPLSCSHFLSRGAICSRAAARREKKIVFKRHTVIFPRGPTGLCRAGWLVRPVGPRIGCLLLLLLLLSCLAVSLSVAPGHSTLLSLELRAYLARGRG